MRTQLIYIANDGTIFETKEDCAKYEMSKKTVLTSNDIANLIIKDVDFSNVDLCELVDFSKELIRRFEEENGNIDSTYINKKGNKIRSHYVLYEIVNLKLVEVVRNNYSYMRTATEEQIRTLIKKAEYEHGSNLTDMIEELISLIEVIRHYIH